MVLCDTESFSVGPPSAIIETGLWSLMNSGVTGFSVGPPSAIIETSPVMRHPPLLRSFSVGPPSAIIETSKLSRAASDAISAFQCRPAQCYH